MKFAITAIALAAMCATPAMAEDTRMNHAKHMEAKTRHMFDKADADGNGVVTKIEHEAFANTMFRNADKNHNNVVTYGEMKAAKVAEMNEMKEHLRKRNAMDDETKDRY